MPELTAEQHRQALARRVAPDAVRWDDETLASHRRDTWCLSVLRGMRGQLESKALCVVTPANTEQVVAALGYANEQQLSVVPFGAGSGVCGGVLPPSNAIVVDMRRMNQVLDLNDKALTARVQAGMMGGVLEAE